MSDTHINYDVLWFLSSLKDHSKEEKQLSNKGFKIYNFKTIEELE